MSDLPTLYPDANIFSALHYSGGNVEMLAQKQKTLKWWNEERRYFRLFGSKFVESELRDGSYAYQAKTIAAIRRIPYSNITGRARKVTLDYLDAGLVPDGEHGDALHIAITSLHSIDYLLTWDYAHMVREEVQTKLNALNLLYGLRSPRLVSPDTIPWASMGHTIRRRS